MEIKVIPVGVIPEEVIIYNHLMSGSIEYKGTPLRYKNGVPYFIVNLPFNKRGEFKEYIATVQDPNTGSEWSKEQQMVWFRETKPCPGRTPWRGFVMNGVLIIKMQHFGITSHKWGVIVPSLAAVFNEVARSSEENIISWYEMYQDIIEAAENLIKIKELKTISSIYKDKEDKYEECANRLVDALFTKNKEDV